MSQQFCKVTKKERFPTELECDLAIIRIQSTNSHHRHRKFREEPSRSYPCEFCSGWHMTSQPERESLTR